jgi:hypothetical protein
MKYVCFLTNKSYIGTDLVVFINFWYYQELSSFVYRSCFFQKVVFRKSPFQFDQERWMHVYFRC